MIDSRNLFFKLFLRIILSIFFFFTPSYALGLTLQWDANGEANLDGYNIYYDTDAEPPYEGTGALEGNSPIDMPLDLDENLDPDIVEFTLNNLPEGTYYFAVTAYNDEVPPLESDYSDEVNTMPSGDTTPPVISNILVSSKTDTTAVIEWTTDETSDSVVQYGIGSSTWGSYQSSQNNISMVTSHSITLTGLNGGTTYYFRVGSKDAADNGPTVSNELSFTTDPYPDTTPPVISNVLVASKTESAAIIEWTTDELSDSVVQYGIGETYYSGQSDVSMVTSHSIDLTGLDPNTTYNYRVYSTDASGNPSSVSGMSFTTDATPDVTPPIISNVRVSSKTHNTALIEWTTDEGSDSDVQYGTSSSSWGSYSSNQSSGSVVSSHSINLTGLNPSTTYYFRVGSIDPSNNGPSVSNELSFTTNPPPDTIPPIISNVWVSSKTHNTAVIEWSTNEQSDSAVQYGTSSSSWGSYPSTQNNGSMVTSHSITLPGLNGSTRYYFQVGSKDQANNGPTVSSEISFTTDPTPDTTPPVISNVRVSSKTFNTAVIEWTTDEVSDSVVQYGTSSSSWGSYPSNQSNGSMVTNHSVTLTGLNGSTTYYFRVGSTDGSDNGPTTSNQSNFTTDPTPDTTPPVLSNVQVASYTHNSAVITWTTNENSTSILRYGTGSNSWANYPSSESDVGLVTNHSVTLTGLNGSTTYYFRVGSTDSSDNGPSVSNELSFTTNPPPDTTPPVISNVQVSSKTHDIAIIEWETNEQSDSNLQYGPNSNSWGGYPSNQSNGTMMTNHSITLSGFNGSTTYHFMVASKDAANNGPTISNEFSFTTDPTPDTDSPSMVQFPTIDYANDTIDVTFSESNMQNTTTEANYTFSPSLLFGTLGGSNDIVSVGNNTYRLSMSSIPKNLIFTLTLNNIEDGAGNPLTPSSARVNDNDNDGLPDDWEVTSGVGSPSEDSDLDGLINLEEYDNSTNPNNPDTDNDGLPDGWEVTYGLDPNDSTGSNGGDGDPDNDGWTNYEEYSNGYFPNSDTSPQPAPPKIKKAIPTNNSGITNGKRIPVDTSFSVLIEDLDGVDITDTTSVKFTIDDGTNPTYERDLADTAVVRVVKLTADPDSKVSKFWAVYDRSLDTYGNFDYDANVNIKVGSRDRRNDTMPPAGFDFNIETTNEHDVAKGKRPKTNSKKDVTMTILTVVDNVELEGYQVIYNDSEPITPIVEPLDEIPSLDLPYVTPVERPVKMGPPNVFNNPVTLTLPISGADDVKDMSVYLYDDEEWVYAVSSYNTGGVIQPGGEDWVVPGSLTYDDTGATPILEVQVYHFSGIQAGFFFELPFLGIDDIEASTGGCFIDTMNSGASSFQKSTGYMRIFILLLLISLTLSVWRRRA